MRSTNGTFVSNLEPNHADSDLPTFTVGIFETRLLRQLFGLERLRQDHKFEALVFEEQPSHRFFHVGIYSTVNCVFAGVR